MSIQPSQISSHDANQEKWHKLLNLADIVSTQFSLKSLLSYTIHLLEQDFGCKVRIWLDPLFSALIAREDIQPEANLTIKKTPLMDQVYLERQIISVNLSNHDEVNALGVIVIPLIANDKVLGVKQLDMINQAGTSLRDFEFIIAFASQFSLALYHLQYSTLRQYMQQSTDHLNICDEISKSVFSNLDRASLLNNLLSLLHQKFNFARVNIFLVRGDDSKILKKIGISPQGIEPEKVYYIEGGSAPLAQAISLLEPEIINNINLSLKYSISDLGINIKSEIILPLLYGNIFIGALELCSEFVDGFDPATLKGWQILAQNIALAMRNANLYHSVQTKWDLNDRLQAELGVLSAEVSLDDLLQILLDALEDYFSWDAAAIWLFERIASEAGMGQFTSPLNLAAFRIKDQAYPETEQNVPQNSNELFDKYINNTIGEDDLFSLYPWISELLNSKKPVIRNSPFQYEPLGAILNLNSDYSALGIPLIINDRPIGIIVLAHHLPDQYDDEFLSLARAFARQASNAVENIRLYAAAHDQAWISTVLLQVSDATQSISSLDDLLDTVVNMLPGLIGVDACSIFLWDLSIDAFIHRASHGFDKQQMVRFDDWEIIPGSVSAFDELRKNLKPVILDTNSLSDDVAAHIFPDYDFNKNLMIVFPLTSQTSLCGAILFDFSNSSLAKDSPQEVWDETYTLIDGAARQTAVAIENLRLIKSQEEEAYTSIALLQVAQAIVSFTQLDEILSSVVRITPILVGVRRCIIYLWDNKELTFQQSEYFGFSKNELDLLGQVFRANEFPFVEAIQQHNQILYHPLTADDSPLTWCNIGPGEFQVVEEVTSDSETEISLKLDARSLVNRERLLFGFPLSVKGEVLGVMLIEEEEPINGSPSLHIRERRIEIVKGITQQAAIAIQNELLQQEAVKSERMERELQLAREIQATFLPEKLPELTGWDIDARWQPAREVGGDFYDILMLDDDQIGFVIADVADKGMPAALFMTLIRTLIRAAAKEKTSPAAVLKQVNELMIPDSKHGMFVTVFYAVFSVNSGRLVYANAGHNPPLVKRVSQDGLTELTRTSIALGIFDEIDVDERELLLNPGDWILFYTDGVTEAFSAKEEMFGTQRLFDLLEKDRFISSNLLLDRIVGSVNEFIQGVDLSDDVTLAAFYRKPIS
jgi:sigma-B regulation protein RsbU (phosphoserine phosphatase)